MSSVRFRILCPRRTETGGPEALHQLGAALRLAGFDAAIHYVPASRTNTCPPKYMHYGVPIDHELPDEPNMVVVIPEVMTDWVWRFRRAQLVIWWLSVDFYLFRPTKWTKRVKRWLRERLPSRRAYAFEAHPRVRHANHGEHTRRFLHAQGVLPLLSLTEYIAPALTVPESDVPSQQRFDRCLYNPRKGHAFTQRVILASAHLPIEFVPLIGFDEAQLRVLYSTSKLYIDFGEHPGRERMPREAAASGCIVLTGRRGSASNAIDVPLPDYYKLDDALPHVLSDLTERLLSIMSNYAWHRAAQAPYRAWVRGQREVFLAEAAALGNAYAGRGATA